MSAHTTLITGLPRSGTTLTVSLLNQQDNAVALAEPLPIWKMSDDRARFIDELADSADAIRARALSEGIIPTKTVDGALTGNFVTDRDQGQGLRKSMARTLEIAAGKPLTPDFRLYIKHPVAFSVLAVPLARRFPVYACIRNPLAVLASWQTVDMAINRGRAPMAERFSPSFTYALDNLPDALSRQVFLMGHFLEAYTLLPPEHILRFEDLVRDPQEALSHICPGARAEAVALETQDLSERYPSVDIDRLRAAIRPIEPLILHHYPDGLPY